MAYLDPEKYHNWKSMLREGDIHTSDAMAAGRNMGKIHRHTANRSDIAADFAYDENIYDLRLHPYLVTTAGRHPDVAEVLLKLVERTASTKRALVHGDFSPKNILIGPNGPIFLDAECAWYGDPAFDPAFCINHFLLKCVWRPQFRSQYLGSAEAFWTNYIDEIGDLDTDIETRTASLTPGLMLARIDGKSPVEYLTDNADRDIVREFAKRGLLAPPATVADLIGRWRRHLQ
jgi:hypothetical protein